MKIKILLIGPLPPPITGQSIAFSYLKNLDDHDIKFIVYNTNKYKLNLFNYLDSILILPIIILFEKFQKIYFIGSRSRLGFLRQLPFLTISIYKKIKIFNHLHGADFKPFYNNSGILKGLIFLVYSKVDTSILLLKEMEDQFIDFPNMNLKIIPNAMGKDFENLKIKKPVKNRILYLSNILASKGILEFMDAVAIILSVNKEVEVNIAGDFLKDHIMSKNEIKKRFFLIYNSLKLKYNNRVSYLGVVSGKNKVDILKSSSIFVLPSYYPTEAFPISIIEAMAASNAIVTTNHNYLKSIISEENGVIVNKKNSNEIYLALRRLLNDDKKLKKIQEVNYLKSNSEYKLESHINKIISSLNEEVS